MEKSSSNTNQDKTPNIQNEQLGRKRSLSFDDRDTLFDGEKRSTVIAPKTLERLEKISKQRHEQRKMEEEAEEDDDEKLVIGDSLKLQNLDIHDLNKKVNLEPDPILDNIEVLV